VFVVAEDVVIPPSPAGEGAEEAPAADETKTEATPKQKHDKLRTLAGNLLLRCLNGIETVAVAIDSFCSLWTLVSLAVCLLQVLLQVLEGLLQRPSRREVASFECYFVVLYTHLM
jgi:hypothetical protein